MSTLRSGIYTIIHYLYQACMEEVNTELGCWDNGDRESLQWHVKPVAKGYLIKNCESGRYLANHETIDKMDDSAPHCGDSTTVWNFDIQPGKDTYLIRRQGYYYLLHCKLSQTIGQKPSMVQQTQIDPNDTDSWAQSWAQYGFIGIVMVPSIDYSYNKWIFEYLRDTTDEEVHGETPQIDEISTANDQQILEQTRCIAELSIQLTEKDKKVLELQQQLTRQAQSLAKAKTELRQTKEALALRDAELLALQENNMKEELSRQKEDVSHIRARVQVIEQFMLSQMRISDSTRPNNAT